MRTCFLMLLLASVTCYSQNVGIGTTTPQSKLSVGTNSEFRVDPNGNVIRINNVPYNFPSVQGANGKTLVNDGSGNFSWKEAQEPIGSMVFCYPSDTAGFISRGYSILGVGEFYFRSRNSATGTWTPYSNAITLTGSPYFQDDPSVWNGTEMMIYYNNIVYRWNPAGTAWTQSAINNIPGFTAVTNASAIWTGTDMIIYGGLAGSVFSNKGVKYNPSTNTWTSISNGPYKKANHTAVWTGTEMIVWGGDTSNSGNTQTGYRYNPSSNTWSAAISTSGAPSPRSNAGAVWTGSKMLITCGNDIGTSATYNDCYSYDPAVNTWSTLAYEFYGFSEAKAVWTGNEMLVWSSYYNNNLNTNYNLGKVYTLSTNTWSDMANEGSYGNSDFRSDVVWTGTQMLLVRGYNAQYFAYTGQGYAILTPYLNGYYIMRKYTQN